MTTRDQIREDNRLLAGLRIVEAVAEGQIDEDHGIYVARCMAAGRLEPCEVLTGDPGHWCDRVRGING